MKATIKKYISIYKQFWKLSAKLSLLYRADSLMLLVGVILVLGINILFFDLIFDTTGDLGGWGFYEIILLQGIFQMTWGFSKLMFLKAMETAMEKIFDGEFDFLLLKPINEKFLAFALPPMTKGLPTQIAGVLFVIIGLSNINIEITVLKIVFMVIYAIIAQVILFSTFQIIIAITFYSGQADEIFSVLEHAWQYARYPGTVFEGKVYAFLTFIVPVTIFASYPTAILLGKVIFTPWNLLYPMLVAIGMLTLSNNLYKMGVKSYSSASS